MHYHTKRAPTYKTTRRMPVQAKRHKRKHQNRQGDQRQQRQLMDERSFRIIIERLKTRACCLSPSRATHRQHTTQEFRQKNIASYSKICASRACTLNQIPGNAETKTNQRLNSAHPSTHKHTKEKKKHNHWQSIKKK